MRKLLLVSALIACGAASARAQIMGCPGSRWPWKDQGPFVDIPSNIAAGPVMGTGGAAFAILMFPVDLAVDREQAFKQDGTIPRFSHAGLCGGVYLGEAVAFAAGLPFFILKQSFWDGPRWLLGYRDPAASK